MTMRAWRSGSAQLARSRRTGGPVPSRGRWPPASCPAASRSKSSCLSAEFLIYKLALSAVGARQADSESRRRSCRSTRPRRTCFFTNKLWPGSAPGQPSGDAAAGRAQGELLAQLMRCAQHASTFRAERDASAWAGTLATCCMRKYASRSFGALSHVSLVCARSFVELWPQPPRGGRPPL